MPNSKSNYDKGRLIFTALLGMSIIAVVQIVGRTELDISLIIALYCFAVAIPFLASFIWMIDSVSDPKKLADAWYYDFVGIIGALGALAGIGAIFWHFSKIIGVVFIVCSMFGFCSMIAYSNLLERASK